MADNKFTTKKVYLKVRDYENLGLEMLGVIYLFICNLVFLYAFPDSLFPLSGLNKVDHLDAY